MNFSGSYTVFSGGKPSKVLFWILMAAAVVLFVLRALKDADFQPRIALVTRTITNSISDLAHFIVLLGSVATGYAIAGTILFGHQYDAFSTLTNSCFYIIILLIAFNPGEGWVQVSSSFLSSCMTIVFLIILWSDESCCARLCIQHIHLVLDPDCTLHSGTRI